MNGHAYQNQTAHHVQAAAKAGEEHGLVGGNHPPAAGLQVTLAGSPRPCGLVVGIVASCRSCGRGARDASQLSQALLKLHAPSPTASRHRAAGTSSGNRGRGSRGRPSCCRQCELRVRRGPKATAGAGELQQSRRAAELTYPAILRSVKVMRLVCGGQLGVGGAGGVGWGERWVSNDPRRRCRDLSQPQICEALHRTRHVASLLPMT